MSTPSARRLKERGGGGAKVAVPSAGKISSVSAMPISTGKENPRLTSRVRSATQRPNIRPMARIDKTAAAAPSAQPRPSWSSSSVPRGRGSSPSEFTRVLSDLRKNSSGVSLGPPLIKGNCANLKGLSLKADEKTDLEKGVIKELDRSVNIRASKNGFSDVTQINPSSVLPERSDCGNNVLKDMKRNAGNLEEFEGVFQENEKIKNRGSNGIRDKNSNSIPNKSTNMENCSEQSNLEPDHKSTKVFDEAKMNSCAELVPSGLSSRESIMVSKVSKFPDVLKDSVTNKFPSKLREKLAFLEGKVKKIASDINRTKEMLDLNNPDASKMILSDIQEKITGIEKVMVHVDRDGDCKTGLVKCRETKEKTKEKEVTDSKSLVKGLSVEELEARLFPHHKLLRDRTLSKSTSRGFETNSATSTSNNDVKVSSLDENDIAVEFLASLSKEEHREEKKIQEMDGAMTYVAEGSALNAMIRKCNVDALLMADEKLDEFDDQDREPAMIFAEGIEENNTYTLNDIGCKTSTGGWFVSEGESVLLAHDDGSCSFYDIANCEIKAEYKPPSGILPNTWRDCWLIRAPNSDGCTGKYVVAASSGNSTVSGFCSWDFYTKDIRAFHSENETTRVRTALAPLSNNTMYGKNALSISAATTGIRQCWYKPCGPLITSTVSCQRMVHIYDIRDGEQVMKWDLQKPVLAMDYGSPLHWRSRGKVVVAESDGLSLWDVNSLSSQALLSVSSSGRKISALHVNNTDAEVGGGVRQRISSSESEGNDGVFCTPDSINVLDFRNPSGIALKIPTVGTDVHSSFSSGDNIYIGCSSSSSPAKNKYASHIQQFSLRKQKLFSTYKLPGSNAHHHGQFKPLTQVWGNSNLVMGVCGLGLFVFDSLNDYGLLPFAMDYGNDGNLKEVIGPDDMCYPSFDYLASRVLLVSEDRPARWRYLLEVI